MDLATLLRWKTDFDLKDQNDKPILDDAGNPVKIYMRIVGDFDLQESFRLARMASAEKRKRLRDPESDDYKAEIKLFEEASKEECELIIKTSRSANWYSQAFSAVIRPDEVKISDVAVDPDAPTLEEQEKLDAANEEADAQYRRELDQFVETKGKELDEELSKLELTDLRLLAQIETSIILPLNIFMSELVEQKVWRSIYLDKDYTVRAYRDVKHYRDTPDIIKKQLEQAYTELESREDGLKN